MTTFAYQTFKGVVGVLPTMTETDSKRERFQAVYEHCKGDERVVDVYSWGLFPWAMHVTIWDDEDREEFLELFEEQDLEVTGGWKTTAGGERFIVEPQEVAGEQDDAWNASEMTFRWRSPKLA